MGDPYDLYAKEILGLRLLDPIDSDPGAAEFGTLVHEALEVYLKESPKDPSGNPEAALLAAGHEVFWAEEVKPGVRALWWPRFQRIAYWFAREERKNRPAVNRSFGELRGTLRLDLPGGVFELTAKADRIDLLRDGGLVILDYKTGTPPSPKAVDLGFASQLPLEAAIALGGGFKGLPQAPVARLEYWRVSGGLPPGEVKPFKTDKDPAERADEALQGLVRLITRFDQPDTPYYAIPRPEWASRFSDYAHLERVKEWGAGANGTGDG